MRATKSRIWKETARTALVRSGEVPAYVASVLAFASQSIHLWVLQEELLFRPLSGGLMFLAAVSQGILVVGLLFGAGRWMLRYGLLLNALLVIVWGTTRFVGSPGLLGFDGLPVKPLNVAALISEAGVVVLLLAVILYRARERGVQER